MISSMVTFMFVDSIYTYIHTHIHEYIYADTGVNRWRRSERAFIVYNSEIHGLRMTPRVTHRTWRRSGQREVTGNG